MTTLRRMMFIACYLVAAGTAYVMLSYPLCSDRTGRVYYGGDAYKVEQRIVGSLFWPLLLASRLGALAVTPNAAFVSLTCQQGAGL